MKKITALLVPLLLFFVSPHASLAQTTGVLGGRYSCQLADIRPNQTTGQNWDVTYCVAAETPQQLNRITQITSTCREAPLSEENIIGDITQRQNCSCYYDNNMKFDVLQDPIKNLLWGTCVTAAGLGSPKPASSTTQNLSADLPILLDNDPNSPNFGKYYTCFTLNNLDRNMGVIETELQDAQGQTMCRPENADVLPGNYGWFEYFDNTTESRFGFGLGTDPTERGPGDLFCSTITGKGTDTDNPFSFITGIENPAINTALGCIATDPVGFTRDYLTISIGIGGALALILLLYAFFIMATSQGDPTKVQEGKQIISSVIQGLLVIILSVVLLNFLGINVLGLPGLI